MFRPITFSEEERLELIKNSMSFDLALSELKKCKSIEDFYHYSRKVKNGVLSQMELYILENYKKVPLEEWNDNNFSIITHISGKKMYFGKKDVFENKFINSKALEKFEKERYDESIKITNIEFVLDYHDGDFSVTFNKGPWSFLDEERVVKYYYVIKRYLNNEKV